MFAVCCVLCAVAVVVCLLPFAVRCVLGVVLRVQCAVC